MITRPFDYGTVITYPFLPQNWQATPGIRVVNTLGWKPAESSR